MTRVSDVDDPEAPTVLLVDNNQMALHRLSGIFRQKEFVVVTCEDGDKAVDEYIRLDPELVVMSLDIPSLDGHLAALEMREHDDGCRVIFTAPKRQAKLAQDATHSAGGLAWIEKPISASAFETIWPKILGPIPDAPGLEDLDEIHPEKANQIEIEPDDSPNPPDSIPVVPVLETAPVVLQTTPKKRSSKGKRFFVVVLLFSALGAGGWFAHSQGLLPF
jgi:CheY-like chemotaxis protein